MQSGLCSALKLTWHTEVLRKQNICFFCVIRVITNIVCMICTITVWNSWECLTLWSISGYTSVPYKAQSTCRPWCKFGNLPKVLLSHFNTNKILAKNVHVLNLSPDIRNSILICHQQHCNDEQLRKLMPRGLTRMASGIQYSVAQSHRSFFAEGETELCMEIRENHRVWKNKWGESRSWITHNDTIFSTSVSMVYWNEHPDILQASSFTCTISGTYCATYSLWMLCKFDHDDFH